MSFMHRVFLSVFEDFEEALSQWIDLLSENGKFFLSIVSIQRISMFLSDTATTPRTMVKTDLNTFSINTLKRYLNSKNLSHQIKKFALPLLIYRSTKTQLDHSPKHLKTNLESS